MHFRSLALTGLISQLASAQSTSDPNLLCITESQPNPISSTYPKDVTGTINGTTAIVPIPLSIARSIIPSQYSILTSAYESLIPNFPKDSFPAEFEAVLDHDVGLGPLVKIPDFQRIALRFPFVDRLGDGYSCFRYTAPQLISATNLVALLGSEMYGKTEAGNFEPNCNAYTYDGNSTETTVLKTFEAPGSSVLGSSPAFDTKWTTVGSIPYQQKL